FVFRDFNVGRVARSKKNEAADKCCHAEDFVMLSIANHALQIPHRSARFVRWGAIRRAPGTHPRPISQGPQAGTARNRTDDTDYLSIRLVYRRLDTSSPLMPQVDRARKLKRSRPFDQYSSFDESDRTCAAHGVQADGHALTSRADDGGYFAVGQGDVDEHAFGFGDAVTHGKIGQQAVETRRNRVEREVGQPPLGVIKSLTD